MHQAAVPRLVMSVLQAAVVLLFDPVHLLIPGMDNGIHRSLLSVSLGNADTDGGSEAIVAEGGLEIFFQLPALGLYIGKIVMGLDSGKFISADPGLQGVRKMTGNQAGGLDQYLVADGMPEGIINQFKPVQIHIDQDQRLSHVFLQGLIEITAVVHAREHIRVRHIKDGALVGALVGNVLDRAEITGNIVQIVPDFQFGEAQNVAFPANLDRIFPGGGMGIPVFDTAAKGLQAGFFPLQIIKR